MDREPTMDFGLGSRARQQADSLNDDRHGTLPLDGHDMYASHAGDLVHLLDDLDADVDPCFLPGRATGLLFRTTLCQDRFRSQFHLQPPTTVLA